VSKLHQITAVLKGVKARTYAEVSALHKDAQKVEPYNGFAKTFRKKDEDGEDYPPESKKVTLVAADVLRRVARIQTEVFDMTAQQDWANMKAKADVVVDGQVLLSDVPVTYLLFLEKQLTDVRTFVDKMPTLDENKDWNSDPNSNLVKTERVSTFKTKKVQRPIVKYDAVIRDGHALPAQTEMITEDILVGWWDTTFQSGALSVPRKELLLSRIDTLIRAVKFAREAANDQEVEERPIGARVFGYLFA
jgi:hypothetical protein